MPSEVFRRHFSDAVKHNLENNILPYWIGQMPDPRGGFYGRRDGHDTLHPDALKGAVLNARILWTFAACFRMSGDITHRAMADRALDALTGQFYDHTYGGVFWSVNPDGTPADTHKQFYAIGFAIYGLAEYAAAAGTCDPAGAKALDYAVRLFRSVEEHSRDGTNEGYIEATTRNWQPIADMRLSDKDMNVTKSMNTHLHIIEPYTRLLSVWPDPELKEAVAELLDIFFDKIEDRETHHLGLFFDNNWQRADRTVSYGHDIEASWLLLESARILGDPLMLEKAQRHTYMIACAALEGLRNDGSMIYERIGDNALDTDRHWWVQAETVIGELYLWKYHNRPDMLRKAWETWNYIDGNIVDHTNGEWYWKRLGSDGSVDYGEDKAGFWKCPYHNSRMCLEAITILH